MEGLSSVNTDFCDKCNLPYCTESNCKLMCSNCGGRLDCSDLFKTITIEIYENRGYFESANGMRIYLQNPNDPSTIPLNRR